MPHFGMKGRHVDQIAAGRVPNGMVNGDEVVQIWVVGDVTMMEHPSKLRAASVLLHLAFDILETSRRLSPFFWHVAGEPELLAAYRTGKYFDLFAQV